MNDQLILKLQLIQLCLPTNLPTRPPTRPDPPERCPSQSSKFGRPKQCLILSEIEDLNLFYGKIRKYACNQDDSDPLPPCSTTGSLTPFHTPGTYHSNDASADTGPDSTASRHPELFSWLPFGLAPHFWNLSPSFSTDTQKIECAAPLRNFDYHPRAIILRLRTISLELIPDVANAACGLQASSHFECLTELLMSVTQRLLPAILPIQCPPEENLSMYSLVSTRLRPCLSPLVLFSLAIEKGVIEFFTCQRKTIRTTSCPPRVFSIPPARSAIVSPYARARSPGRFLRAAHELWGSEHPDEFLGYTASILKFLVKSLRFEDSANADGPEKLDGAPKTETYRLIRLSDLIPAKQGIARLVIDGFALSDVAELRFDEQSADPRIVGGQLKVIPHSCVSLGWQSMDLAFGEGASFQASTASVQFPSTLVNVDYLSFALSRVRLCLPSSLFPCVTLYDEMRLLASQIMRGLAKPLGSPPRPSSRPAPAAGLRVKVFLDTDTTLVCRNLLLRLGPHTTFDVHHGGSFSLTLERADFDVLSAGREDCVLELSGLWRLNCKRCSRYDRCLALESDDGTFAVQFDPPTIVCAADDACWLAQQWRQLPQSFMASAMDGNLPATRPASDALLDGQSESDEYEFPASTVAFRLALPLAIISCGSLRVVLAHFFLRSELGCRFLRCEFSDVDISLSSPKTSEVLSPTQRVEAFYVNIPLVSAGSQVDGSLAFALQAPFVRVVPSLLTYALMTNIVAFKAAADYCYRIFGCLGASSKPSDAYDGLNDDSLSPRSPEAPFAQQESHRHLNGCFTLEIKDFFMYMALEWPASATDPYEARRECRKDSARSPRSFDSCLEAQVLEFYWMRTPPASQSSLPTPLRRHRGWWLALSSCNWHQTTDSLASRSTSAAVSPVDEKKTPVRERDSRVNDGRTACLSAFDNRTKCTSSSSCAPQGSRSLSESLLADQRRLDGSLRLEPRTYLPSLSESDFDGRDHDGYEHDFLIFRNISVFYLTDFWELPVEERSAAFVEKLSREEMLRPIIQTSAEIRRGTLIPRRPAYKSRSCKITILVPKLFSTVTQEVLSRAYSSANLLSEEGQKLSRVWRARVRLGRSMIETGGGDAEVQPSIDGPNLATHLEFRILQGSLTLLQESSSPSFLEIQNNLAAASVRPRSLGKGELLRCFVTEISYCEIRGQNAQVQTHLTVQDLLMRSEADSLCVPLAEHPVVAVAPSLDAGSATSGLLVWSSMSRVVDPEVLLRSNKSIGRRNKVLLHTRKCSQNAGTNASQASSVKSKERLFDVPKLDCIPGVDSDDFGDILQYDLVHLRMSPIACQLTQEFLVELTAFMRSAVRAPEPDDDLLATWTLAEEQLIGDATANAPRIDEETDLYADRTEVGGPTETDALCSLDPTQPVIRISQQSRGEPLGACKVADATQTAAKSLKMEAVARRPREGPRLPESSAAGSEAEGHSCGVDLGGVDVRQGASSNGASAASGSHNKSPKDYVFIRELQVCPVVLTLTYRGVLNLKGLQINLPGMSAKDIATTSLTTLIYKDLSWDLVKQVVSQALSSRVRQFVGKRPRSRVSVRKATLPKAMAGRKKGDTIEQDGGTSRADELSATESPFQVVNRIVGESNEVEARISEASATSKRSMLESTVTSRRSTRRKFLSTVLRRANSGPEEETPDEIIQGFIAALPKVPKVVKGKDS